MARLRSTAVSLVVVTLTLVGCGNSEDGSARAANTIGLDTACQDYLALEEAEQTEVASNLSVLAGAEDPDSRYWPEDIASNCRSMGDRVPLREALLSLGGNDEDPPTDDAAPTSAGVSPAAQFYWVTSVIETLSGANATFDLAMSIESHTQFTENSDGLAAGTYGLKWGGGTSSAMSGETVLVNASDRAYYNIRVGGSVAGLFPAEICSLTSPEIALSPYEEPRRVTVEGRPLCRIDLGGWPDGFQTLDANGGTATTPLVAPDYAGVLTGGQADVAMAAQTLSQGPELVEVQMSGAVAAASPCADQRLWLLSRDGEEQDSCSYISEQKAGGYYGG